MAMFQCKNYKIIRNLDGIENSFENLLRALQECILGKFIKYAKYSMNMCITSQPPLKMPLYPRWFIFLKGSDPSKVLKETLKINTCLE